MPLITNDEGRLVFLPTVDTPGGVMAAPASAVSVPRDDMSHLSAQQGLLLALARVDQDRACRREAAKRCRESEEDGHGARAVGRSEATPVVSAVDNANATGAGVGHGSTCVLIDASISASSAGASHAGEAVMSGAAHGDAVGAASAEAPSGSGGGDALQPQGGNESIEIAHGSSGGGLHFHLHVEQGDRPALAAGWQVRGANPELASLLAELGASEYHADDGDMVRDIGQCMVVHAGTFGSATSLVTESAVAFTRLSESMAARVSQARSLRSRKSVSWADIKGAAQGIAAAVGVAKPLTLFGDSVGLVEGAAARLEREQRSAEMEALLAVVPVRYHAECVGATEREWAKYPLARRSELLTRHLCSFSAGSLAGCRRALLRLSKWLLVNDLGEECAGYQCSGATLSCFGIDEQSVSRGGGRTVIHSLRSGLEFGRRHLALVGLRSDHDAFVNIAALPPRPPTPARAVTVDIFFHFMWLSRNGCRVSSLYGSLFVVCCIAALRVRDAQRAALRIARAGLEGGPASVTLAGTCYTSKHPKRRAAMPMPFFVVAWPSHTAWYECAVAQCCSTSGESNGRDYLFPALRVPRRKTFGDGGVAVLDTPARSATVIAVLRWMLTLPPLSLNKTEAASYSGHSMRHFMPTLARFMAVSEEDRHELARWAATCDTRGRRHSMPNRYASEAEAPRIFQIQRDLFERLDKAIGAEGVEPALARSEPVLPLREGWPALQRALESGSGASDASRFAPPDAEVGAECSSSDSDDD
jgi:hypothetical protein